MILQAKNISKRYGNHLAVDNIQLQFKRGTFNAILGPNGAGKSTTISMLIGLKQPTKGEIIYEPGAKIGMVFQTSVLDEMLTVRENLIIRAKQYKGLKPNRVSDLIPMQLLQTLHYEHQYLLSLHLQIILSLPHLQNNLLQFRLLRSRSHHLHFLN